MRLDVLARPRVGVLPRPKAALSSLWETLDNLGIAPHAVDHAIAIEAAAAERAARDAAASERGKHAAPIGASRP